MDTIYRGRQKAAPLSNVANFSQKNCNYRTKFGALIYLIIYRVGQIKRG